jgi:hypothetical protein
VLLYNDYLFSISCAVSPICVCKQRKEIVKRYLLECPRYATQRATLLTSAWLHSFLVNRGCGAATL